MSTREFANMIVRDIAIIKSYSLWKDPAFRAAANFAGLTPKKQDIIFNELEACSIAYLLFFLEDKKNKAKSQDKIVYANIAEYIVEAFLEVMADTDMDLATLEAWRVLINKRVGAYRADMASLLKESSGWEAFKGQDKFLRETWGRIVTLSLNTAKQISGQKTVDVKNASWKELRKYLISLEVDLVNTFTTEDVSSLRVLN